MPEVECDVCHCKHFYNNISGTTIDGKCIECEMDIRIPYISAHRMIEEETHCENCGEPMNIGVVNSRGYMSYRDGSHGISKRFKRTPTKYTKKICEKCESEEHTNRERVPGVRSLKYDEKKILESYKKTGKVKDTAIEVSCDAKIVRRVLRKNGIRQRTKK